MKYITLFILVFVATSLKAQQTTTIVTKIARVRYREVGSLEEYKFLKDSLDKLFAERLFVPVLVGPADSVISSDNLPLTVFIKDAPTDLRDLEKKGLTFIGMIYVKLLRSYEQFKKVTVTTSLISAKETKDVQTVYYLQPGNYADVEKRIIVYCKQRRKWTSLKMSQFLSPFSYFYC